MLVSYLFPARTSTILDYFGLLNRSAERQNSSHQGIIGLDLGKELKSQATALDIAVSDQQDGYTDGNGDIAPAQGKLEKRTVDGSGKTRESRAELLLPAMQVLKIPVFFIRRPGVAQVGRQNKQALNQRNKEHGDHHQRYLPEHLAHETRAQRAAA